MTRHSVRGLLVAAMVVGGCALPWAPVGSVRLTVRSTLSDRGVQAVTAPYTASSVDHVVFKAFELKGTSEVAVGTAELAKTALDGGATFEKLAPDTTYRVRAYAYKAAGNADGDKISKDDSSFVDVALGKDAGTATVTIKLIDQTFDGQATGNLAIADGELTPAAPAGIAFKPLTYTAQVAQSGTSAKAAGGWLASATVGDFFSYSEGFLLRGTTLLGLTSGAVKALAVDPVSNTAYWVDTASGIRMYIAAVGSAQAYYSGPIPTALAWGGSPAGLYSVVGNAVLKPDRSVLAGDETASGSIDGAGAAARFANPSDLALASDGTIYVADSFNNLVRKITTAGDVTTVAGTDSAPAATVDGTGAAAKFNEPVAVAVASNGDLYVAEKAGKAIRRIAAGGRVTTLTYAATGDTELVAPNDLVVDSAGYLRVADDKKTGKVVVVKVGPIQ